MFDTVGPSFYLVLLCFTEFSLRHLSGTAQTDGEGIFQLVFFCFPVFFFRFGVATDGVGVRSPRSASDFSATPAS